MSHELQIEIPREQIEAFCRRWKIVEFALFGSVLPKEFGPESDIDVLVTFAPDESWSLFDLATMKVELEDLFDREVDIVEKGTIRNPHRLRAVMDSYQVVYAA